MNPLILSAEQIRAWDAYTIRETPIASIDLMENASLAFVGKFIELYDTRRQVVILCGMGNNGGDGLAIARLLTGKSYAVSVFVLRHSNRATEDFSANLARLQEILPTTEITQTEDLPTHLSEKTVLIDALFGSGLNRPLQGLAGEAVHWINQQTCPVVSVDIASGLFADLPTVGEAVVRPTHTICFEVAKLAFLLPENADFVGEWHAVPIGLHPDFLKTIETPYELSTAERVGERLQPRPKFAHKGTFGHSLIIGGSYGKMGAVTLATRACLRSGTGLLTCYVPKVGYEIMQISVPEAMCLTDENQNFITQIPDCKAFSAIGVGIGLDKQPETKRALRTLLEQKPARLVLDADALNLLAGDEEMRKALPENAILTPHPKEFERLVGKTSNHFERLEKLRTFAQTYRVLVVLKGAHSAIATPAGKIFFNTTGNAGMATGGSGDVLTGIITGFLAQGYSAEQASILGVFLHGLSGDIGIEEQASHALTAGDLIQNIGKAILRLQKLVFKSYSL